MENKFIRAKAKISAPRVSETETNVVCEDSDVWALTEDAYGLLFEHVRFMGLPDNCRNLDRCRFRGCDWSGTSLNCIGFTDCIFENCNLSNLRWNKAGMHRVVLRGCKLTGATLTESFLGEVLLEDCIGEGFGIIHSKLRDVRLQTCRLPQLAIYQCQPTRLEFSACGLHGWDTQETLYRGLDLSDSDISGARFEPSCLRGCRISLEQAAMIAMMQGLFVEL